jgi:hypothetical protein
VAVGPVLFLLLFVVVTAFIAVRQRGKRTGQQDQRRTVLETTAPLVNGAVSSRSTGKPTREH